MTDADWVKVIDAGIRGAIGGAGLMLVLWLFRVKMAPHFIGSIKWGVLFFVLSLFGAYAVAHGQNNLALMLSPSMVAGVIFHTMVGYLAFVVLSVLRRRKENDS